MQTTKKRIFFLIVKILLAILFALFMAWTIYGGFISERTTRQEEIVHRSIEDFSLNAAMLNDYIAKNYPEDCTDMTFVAASLDAVVTDGAIVSGELHMEYYRYINDFYDGGNVAVTTFVFDPVKEELLRIIRAKGSGKSLGFHTDPVSPNTIAFPLTQYVEHLGTLLPISPRTFLRLKIENCHWGIKAMVFRSITVGGYDYCERISDWSPGTPFSERAYTEIESAGGKKEKIGRRYPE